jgi:hypothetical protein
MQQIYRQTHKEFERQNEKQIYKIYGISHIIDYGEDFHQVSIDNLHAPSSLKYPIITFFIKAFYEQAREL